MHRNLHYIIRKPRTAQAPTSVTDLPSSWAIFSHRPGVPPGNFTMQRVSKLRSSSVHAGVCNHRIISFINSSYVHDNLELYFKKWQIRTNFLFLWFPIFQPVIHLILNVLDGHSLVIHRYVRCLIGFINWKLHFGFLHLWSFLSCRVTMMISFSL